MTHRFSTRVPTCSFSLVVAAAATAVALGSAAVTATTGGVTGFLHSIKFVSMICSNKNSPFLLLASTPGCLGCGVAQTAGYGSLESMTTSIGVFQSLTAFASLNCRTASSITTANERAKKRKGTSK